MTPRPRQSNQNSRFRECENPRAHHGSLLVIMKSWPQDDAAIVKRRGTFAEIWSEQG
jgi:hypothetical protein